MLGRALFGNPAAAVWQPTEAHIARSRLAQAMRKWGIADLATLHTEAVDRPDWFWPAAAEDLAIPLKGVPTRIRDDKKGREFPRWFDGCTLNAADSCVSRWAADPAHADRPAVIYEADSGRSRAATFAELQDQIDRFAAALKRLGVGQGDRVALFTPPIPEAAATILACAKIGAIVVPAFSGYGSDALASRLLAAAAKVLVTVDTTSRRGNPVPTKAIADAAAAISPSVQHIVVVRNSGAEIAMTPERDHWWDTLQREPSPAEIAVAPLALDPNHPLFIVYTSGTTGAPKGIVHSHLGFLLKITIDFGYAFDLQPDDTLAWIADMGWALGPMMVVAGMHLGCTLVMIEGLPDHPEPDRIWRVVERNRATVVGLAPTAARSLRARTHAARPDNDLSTLRAFASTGEAWDTPTWHWLFETVGQSRLPILNYSGGTEVGGGILSCYTIAPQAPASFSGPLLGMDVDVLDADGNRATGIGELAILNTWPGMAHSFWGDDARYLATYWNQFQGVWVHGDLASVDADGYWHVHGRSDDTLKIGGRRVGPAEIESALVTQPGIAEAAVIGVPDDLRGQRVLAFVTARPGAAPAAGPALIAAVIAMLGKGMAPAAVHLVATLPKTKNGKIMRRAIRARYLGQPVGDLSALDPATPLDSIPTQSDAP